jgi:hypothetical protein
MPAVFNNEVDWDYYGEPLGLDTGEQNRVSTVSMWILTDED